MSGSNNSSRGNGISGSSGGTSSSSNVKKKTKLIKDINENNAIIKKNSSTSISIGNSKSDTKIKSGDTIAINSNNNNNNNQNNQNNIIHSKEYKELTGVLEVLEQQRKTREDDINNLKRLYKVAISNPIEFIDRLMDGTIVLPRKQEIQQVPNINVNSNSINNINNINNNNNNKKQEESKPLNHLNPIINKLNNYNSKDYQFHINNTTPNVIEEVNDDDDNDNDEQEEKDNGDNVKKSKRKDLKRKNREDDEDEDQENGIKEKKKKKKDKEGGTKKYIPKQDKDFIPWTQEEQVKLEKLLEEFPHEEVAAHRWKKISDALGTRTPKQIASRTQKYFVKLYKLGLPIPGKPPNEPSIYPNATKKKKGTGTSDDENSDPEHPSYHKYKLGDQTKKVFEKETPAIHEGYRCDGCNCEPIVGVRWKCEECIEMDLCAKCHQEYDEIGSHKSSHHMISYRTPVDLDYYLDDDYKFSYQDGDYGSNYLDPNYKPPVK